MRRITDQNTDSQLNPGLQADCRKDIGLYCSKTFVDDRLDPKHLEDRVISCLKVMFVNSFCSETCLWQSLRDRRKVLNYSRLF